MSKHTHILGVDCIRAVNSHANLLAAVKELLAHPTLEYYALRNMPEADYHDFMARYEGVKAAIAKAEEKA